MNRMDGPSVEVVLCTYNGERFLLEQLSSISAQTRLPTLVSVFDDGSADATLSIVERWRPAVEASGMRVRVTRNERNLGYAGNFARGIERASEEILVFADQDDVWETTKIARLVDAIRREGCALTFSDGTLVDDAGRSLPGGTVLDGYGLSRRERRQFGSQAWTLLLRRNFVNGAAMAMRRTDAQAALPIPDGFPHDYWLALSAARGGKLCCVPETLYRYRQHSANVIGAGRGALIDRWASLWRDPLRPRRLDLRRTNALLERMDPAECGYALVRRKRDWLDGLIGRGHRLRRLLNVARTWLRGDYARFASGDAWLRDLIGAVRRPTALS